MSKAIRKGQVVRIRPEWMDDGDDRHVWIATEDQDGPQVRVSPQLGLAINPQQVVDAEMVSLVDDLLVAMAHKVIAMIKADQASRRVPQDLDGFSSLHGHVDANDYLIAADEEPVAFADDECDAGKVQAQCDRHNAVMEHVNRWMATGELP